jgi:uncharacterized protein (DUF2147 family)
MERLFCIKPLVSNSRDKTMFTQTLRTIVVSAAVLFAATAANATTAVNASPLTGVWTTEDGLGAVEFYPCAEKRCGRIVWLKNPRGDDGKPLHDANNPKKEAREKPICELDIVHDLQLQRDGTWDQGTIYDPDEGKTYSVAVKVLPKGDLEVTGYMGSKIFSETMIWHRHAPNFERCSGTSGISAPR